MKFNCRPVLLLGLLFVLTGCVSIFPGKAAIDYKKGYDFTTVSRLALAPVDESSRRDPLLDEATVAQFDSALSEAVAGQGLEMVDDPAQAQLLLRWHLVTRDAQDVREYNSESYFRCWRCGPSISGRSVEDITLGTFIVDMIDPELNQSVWRGVLQGEVEAEQSPAEQARRIKKACQQMLSSFPPRSIFLLGFAT